MTVARRDRLVLFISARRAHGLTDCRQRRDTLALQNTEQAQTDNLRHPCQVGQGRFKLAFMQIDRPVKVLTGPSFPSWAHVYLQYIVLIRQAITAVVREKSSFVLNGY